MPSQAGETGDRTVATNRRARHEYEILETVEAVVVAEVDVLFWREPRPLIRSPDSPA